MSKQLVSRANLLMFGVLVAFLALIGFLTWDRMQAARSARSWTQHTYEVLGTIRELGIAVRDAETSERGYLLSGEDADLAPYEASLAHIPTLQAELQRQTADNDQQQARLRALGPALQSGCNSLPRQFKFAVTSEWSQPQG